MFFFFLMKIELVWVNLRGGILTMNYFDNLDNNFLNKYDIILEVKKNV
jgi:hypothetical protein